MHPLLFSLVGFFSIAESASAKLVQGFLGLESSEIFENAFLSHDNRVRINVLLVSLRVGTQESRPNKSRQRGFRCTSMKLSSRRPVVARALSRVDEPGDRHRRMPSTPELLMGSSHQLFVESEVHLEKC